jgi:hypothetical protein
MLCNLVCACFDGPEHLYISSLRAGKFAADRWPGAT